MNGRPLVALVLAASFAAQSVDRVAQWRQDLAILSYAFKSGQYNFARRNDVAAFDAEIASLGRDAASLADADITLRLMKLVAGAHDGHSQVFLPLFEPFRRLPLSVEWFGDDLAVMSAAPEYADALGLRVTRIGTMTPEQVLSAAAPYIAHENQFALRAESPGYLTTLELLQTIGAADAGSRVTFALEKPDGSPVQVRVAPGSPLKWKMVDVLHRRLDQRYYSFEYLPDSHTMYVQYNSCQNDPARPFAAFARAVLAEADRHPVDRWVIDLRRNGGGHSAIIKPLLNGLAGRAPRQPVFALIGGATFSAAVENAMELKEKLHATLVGEPTGGKPNIFGNPKTITLPNSELRVAYSTTYVRHVSGADPSFVEPDLRVSATLADVLAGRDPVLDAAVNRPSSIEQLPQMLQFRSQWTSPGSAISPSSRTSITASRRSPIAFSR